MFVQLKKMQTFQYLKDTLGPSLPVIVAVYMTSINNTITLLTNKNVEIVMCNVLEVCCCTVLWTPRVISNYHTGILCSNWLI